MIPGSANSLLLTSSGDDGYQIERSLRFNSGDTAYLNRTPSAAGNQKKWTLSFWFKKANIGSQRCIFCAWESNSNRVIVRFLSDKLEFVFQTNGTFYGVKTQRLFRDPSAWAHAVLVLDTGNSTEASRIRIYINGSEIPSTELDIFNTNKYPTQNSTFAANGTYAHYLAANYEGSLQPTTWDGNLAECILVDGQALTPTDFGEFDDNNVWQPKEFAGSYGISYSNNVNLVGTLAGGSVAALFNGNTGTCQGANLATGNTLTLNHVISNVTKIGIHSNTGTAFSMRVNEGLNDEYTVSVPSQNNVSILDEFTGFSGTIQTIKFYNVSASLCLNAIEINGSQLTDAGTNSFHLAFADNSSVSALGTDTSGQGNNWTPNNFDIVSSSLNTSQNWISAGTITGSPYNAANSFPLVFNGGPTTSISNNQAFATGSGTYKYTFSGSGLTVNTSVKIYYWKNGGTLYVNSGETGEQTISASTSAYTSSTYTSAQVGGLLKNVLLSNAGLTGPYLIKIEVDGAILADPTIIGPKNDSLTDTPTNYGSDTGVGGEVRGNYCTWNPLHGDCTLTNGNLQAAAPSTAWVRSCGTIAMSSGKYYWEYTPSTGNNHIVGIGPLDMQISGNLGSGSPPGYGYSSEIGYFYPANSSPAAWTAGDVIGVAFDADAGTLSFYKNGTSQGTCVSGLTDGPWLPVVSIEKSKSGYTNFGQRAWAHTPPSGYKALCTQNLDDPLVADGSTYFDTKLYTGNAGSQSITGMPSPDFLWIKDRTGGNQHCLYDTVRGATKVLFSSLANAEQTQTSGMTAFTSTGFNLNGVNSISGATNQNNNSYVAWGWDAGSSNTSVAAGGLNSAAYDTSQTWSNYVTISEGNTGSNYNTDATNAFDGNTSTSTSLFSGNMVSPYSPTTVVFTPPSAIIVSTGVRVYMATNRGQQIKVNGTQTNSSVSAGWNTVNFTGSLTSLTIGPANAGSSSNIAVIEIDGTVLLDSGVTPPTNVPTIATTVRANPSAGFSIASYTGSGSNATFAHGLNAAPEMVIVKDRDSSYGWTVWHKSILGTQYLVLNTSSATGTAAAVWNGQSPSSSIVHVGTDVGTNNSGDDYIAYCFTGVEGYSKFGKYTGNGSTDGPFIYTGFKIRWLMVKCSSLSGEHWLILDTARDAYNLADATIYSNLSNAEAQASALGIDILSNGFKPRDTNGGTNASGATYIYAAFAEHPFKTSRAR